MESVSPFLQTEPGPSSFSKPAAGFVTVEAWQHLRWLRAAFSTRIPGASLVYVAGAHDLSQRQGEQNLGWTREDDPLLVGANRRRFLRNVTGDPAHPLITVKQVHSGIVHDLTPAETAAPLEGDGLISGVPGQLLGILTADCVPVLVADTRTRVVAAFHAGWRGTLARIVEYGLETLRRQHASRSEDLVAAIGPAIRPCCFEVGTEVQAAFTGAFAYADMLFSNPHAHSRPRLDLQEANRRQLGDAGLGADQIQTVAECTSCCRTADGRRKYFSYRAENGVTGRMLSVIGTDGAVPQS